jgi:23S rRNA (cytosine1962-C5)-methyltransferase
VDAEDPLHRTRGRREVELAQPLSDRASYELLDAGNGRRLERFGDRVVDRPAPGAVELPDDPRAWAAADLRFERERGWSGQAEPWTFEFEGLTVELRTASGGQVGLFPEHAALLPWLRERTVDGASTVLNLFAYTGLASLALAQAGAQVAHVDGSKPAVAWARRNSELSDLADRPIRWLIDDALTFVRREARRGRRYDGVVLDPPAYGHAGRSTWKLEDDLEPLLLAIRDVLQPDGFVVLSSHTTAFGPQQLADALETAIGTERPLEAGELSLLATSGAILELGAYARSA